ncbi:unnamed protein product, partial [Scytosiphon promiscuus]
MYFDSRALVCARCALDARLAKMARRHQVARALGAVALFSCQLCARAFFGASLVSDLRQGVRLRPPTASTATMAESTPDQPEEKRKKKVVVVGGGWAGFGAAKALTEAGEGSYDVTLLDANPNPGGLSAGWRTAGGRAVEAGIKGFWWSYPNIYDLVEKELKIDKPFTDWTRSSFFSPDGLQVAGSCFVSIRGFP